MSNYSLFSVMGLEIEYMLVDKTSLDVQPKSDLILSGLAGKLVNEVSLGDIAVSNELVMHVIELKNNGPRPPNYSFADQFHSAIIELQPLLSDHHLQLLPSGAHPLMDPLLETVRWPHGNMSLYQKYDTIFNCQGHGWANLQSMHVNLPFANDEEFCVLHNTIRLLLPLLPAIAASTPLIDGQQTGFLSSRLDFYGKNQQRVPSISGEIIPEFIRSKAEYQNKILTPMYEDIHEFDPEGILKHEWLNSRAAIAKFLPMAIEIRILDSQEYVTADIAIAKAIHAILKNWHESGSLLYQEKICTTKQLKTIYEKAIKHGLDVIVDDSEVLMQWQLPQNQPMTLRDAWSLMIERVSPDLDLASQRALEHILQHGNLSERILRACHQNFSRDNISSIYQQLADCLLQNSPF